MIPFVLRRVVQAVLVLLALAAVLYAVFYLAPGDSARLACGPKCSTAQVDQIRVQMGLNDPVYQQFWHFLQGVLTGHTYSTGTGTLHCPAPCLGQSYRSGELVTHIIAQKLPATASLAVGAMVLWLVIGLGTGIASALRRGGVTERLLTGFTLVGVATPVFITGIVLLLVFCSWLQWLPYPSYVSLTDDPQQWAWNLLLPWLALALVEAAKYARLTRSAMLETLAEDHIRTFRAYGVSERALVWRHALRGALAPVIALSALDLGTIFGGALLTETLFGIPGLGQQLVQAVQSKDLPIVVGIVLVMGLAVVVANAVADVLYAIADRRVVLA
ncbi:ABC transporter permease [Actinacidiphila sp. DG2A-62]|uniref:ABC transporter permease n=1 Tax=Actinacidiphila sp. DG2A-62 TaxID=3108821 RepID=UPI002DBFA7FB|nr:ABC transporter permease [Actinacidiphila sp. DG2A-62]MEC3996843.1 ABC transporter permease [Actinacidiphila sp. DG2A-62]